MVCPPSPGPVRVGEESYLVEGGPDITGTARICVVVPGTANLWGRLQYGERHSMLLQFGSGNESTDSGSDNNGVISVPIVDDERLPPDVVIAVDQEDQTRQQEPAQREGEEEVEQVANTGEQQSREQEESEQFVKF